MTPKMMRFRLRRRFLSVSQSHTGWWGRVAYRLDACLGEWVAAVGTSVGSVGDFVAAVGAGFDTHPR